MRQGPLDSFPAGIVYKLGPRAWSSPLISAKPDCPGRSSGDTETTGPEQPEVLGLGPLHNVRTE
jgi:hypothetical protein